MIAVRATDRAPGSFHPRLGMREDGAGGVRPLVLVGSLGTTTEMWDPQAERFRADRRVIRFDLPGHGTSPLPSRPFDVSRVAASVTRQLDSLGVRSFDLVGLSFGGAVAQEIAGTRPHRIRRLVLACTALSFGSPAFWRARAVAVRSDGMADVAAASATRWFTPAFAERDPLTYQRTIAQLERTDARGYAGCCEALAAFNGHRGAGAVRAPVLVVAGDLDEATPVDQARALVSALPNARLAVLEGGAHLCNIELADQFSDLVATHCDSSPF